MVDVKEFSGGEEDHFPPHTIEVDAKESNVIEEE